MPLQILSSLYDFTTWFQNVEIDVKILIKYAFLLTSPKFVCDIFVKAELNRFNILFVEKLIQHSEAVTLMNYCFCDVKLMLLADF